jgi:hypothetical protein
MKHGVLKPIDVYCGMAFPEFVGVGVDGRNRAKAAAECGRPCPIRRLVDDNIGGSLTDYIASVNSARRHEDAGMRAAIAVGLEPCYAAEAKERMRKGGGDKVSAAKIAEDLQKSPENPARAGMEKIPYPVEHTTARAAAAAACDVNDRYVQDAKKLAAEAPILFQKLRAGIVNLPTAMEALKRKLEDPSAWAKLLEGAITLDDFNAHFESKRTPRPRATRKETGHKEGLAEAQVAGHDGVACPTCQGRGWISCPQGEQVDEEKSSVAKGECTEAASVN